MGGIKAAYYKLKLGCGFYKKIILYKFFLKNKIYILNIYFVIKFI